MNTEIVSIIAREILDSRSNPTVETTVTLVSGASGTASVPSGASTGAHEARELRDAEDPRYRRAGVRGAVENVNTRIAPALLGVSALEQVRADSIMIALDGTYNKSNLGANAILSVSMAIAHAAANAQHLPLYRYLGGAFCHRMPIPMMNILNGGAHAANNIDIQEFMILPVGAESFTEGVRMCSEVYHALKEGLRTRGMNTGVGDEGGFAPDLPSDEAAIEAILDAVAAAGYSADKDFRLALDVAASEWWDGDSYRLPKRGAVYTSDELAEHVAALVSRYPILSVEDGMGEEDYYGWRRLTERLSDAGTVLVGDDLFVTSAARVRDGISRGIANAVLIKPNQIGTLSETADAIAAARSGGYRAILSHRSGETEDTTIADLSVAFGTDFIKTGAPARGERTAKYNRLMKIESELFAPVYG